MLLNVTNKMATSKGLEEALNTLVEITTSTIGAERGTIFLNDPLTGELYSRVAQGNLRREIRILNSVGIAGWVFTNKKGVIISDPYKDKRFNKAIDERTGFKTKGILCVPLISLKNENLGVTQILNKIDGEFTQIDLELLEAMSQQAAVAIQNNIVIEKMEAARQQELEFLNVVTQVSTELNLSALLNKIIHTITKMLDAERSTLFINDEKTKTLYTEVGEGLGKTQIRLPNNVGIAGTVFTTRKSINIPHPYADLRFNPSFDKKTGFFTRSILCCPVFNKQGKAIGVTQVLNKRGGPFTKDDEAKLEAFTSQISMGIENAKLFDDIQAMKNYNESMLESMSNGVITVNEEGLVATCNEAGVRILKLDSVEAIVGKKAEDFFAGANAWLLEKLEKAKKFEKEHESDTFLDQALHVNGEARSVNVTLQPLIRGTQKLGILVMIEDISSEKRMKSTMSRYMDSGLADKLLAGGEDVLGGVNSVATILFSDIRSFTTLTEELGAEGTVTLLNEYFSVMVECVQGEGGMLDKFIGDAMMVIFGTPFPHDDDPDRGVRAAIKMMVQLREFNEKREKKGNPPIRHGVGLNTDKVVSGNIGSPKRMDYTVIGDGVNLASRLESACKQYGANILISEYTFKSLKATYRTRLVDKVIVKGKTAPVSVYEVLDFMSENTFPNMIEALGHFNDGTSLYHQGKWEQAIRTFEKVLTLNPNDYCSQMYVKRCQHLQENPPEGSWDGVWHMTSK
ncbi:MAG: GAF domain-containing protein [Deltaproteobacteria bacterium]|nr:GAF domain-containing protein [Deltaproteobacteria bacterium]